jgi:hypothetical protein
VRRLALFAASACVVLGPAQAPGTAAPPGDFAVGSAKFTVVSGGQAFPGHFELSAHSGPLGESPSGQIVEQDPDLGTLVADVDCMVVVGHDAMAAGPLRRPVQEGGLTFNYFAVRVEDNGEPVRGQPVDRGLALLLFDRTFENFCANKVLPASPGPIVDSGNVVVNDALRAG